MAQIASINVSTASSSPSSQIANSPTPDSPEAEFLAMLTQASNSANGFTSGDKGGISTSNGANSAGTQSLDSPTSQLETQITQLLNNGISLDQLTKAIASKLFSLTGGASGADTADKVNAVARYLRQGESSTQDPATTAKDIVAKVKALVTALQQQKSLNSTPTDSGNILDASQAGETPTTSTTASTTTSTSQPASPPDTSALPSAGNAFAAALHALQTATTAPASATTPPASTAVSTPQSPPAANAPVTASVDQAAMGSTLAQLVQSVQSPQSPSADASSQDQAAAAAAPAPTGSGSGLQVGTDLNAIASGQGTALGRALLRAVNVDVSRTTSTLAAQVDSTLSTLSASLDDLMTSSGSAAGTGAKASAASGPAAIDSSLSDAAAALMNPSSSSGSQTSFVSTLANAQAPVNVDDIMEQVVHGLSIKNFTDSPTVNIALNPPSLGELSIKLTVSDSTVNATVITQSNDVRNILLENRSQLDQVLANAGLKLGSLNVDVNGQGLQQDADRRQAQRQQVFAPTLSSGDTGTDAAPVQSSGPSMLGSVDLNLLNQLV